ncbi:hypothetical protein WMY93_023751 [Mugilogobius chulae]|uniref:Uncharacterized protein n=1 Tax=Mugilogobius chulae TaxID=88201 RepID=A0AAW0NFQ5_9GOBI
MRELRLIADALEEKVLKPSNLHGTRWLPYVHRAVKIVCDSYPVLLAHFEDMASPERHPKPSAAVLGRAKSVARYLKKFENVLFLHFMCDLLDHLGKLSKIFQKDNLTVDEAVESQETCVCNITALKLQMGPQMSQFYWSVTESDEYKGVPFDNPSLSTLKAERENIIEMKELTVFYKNLLEEAGIAAEDVLADYSQYKMFAQTRTAVPLRELLLSVLKSEERRERFRNLVPLMEVYLILPARHLNIFKQKLQCNNGGKAAKEKEDLGLIHGITDNMKKLRSNKK